MQRTRCSAGTRNPPSPPPTVILISWQQGAELGHPHYWTIQIRSFSPAFYQLLWVIPPGWVLLQNVWPPLHARAPTHTHSHAHTCWVTDVWGRSQSERDGQAWRVLFQSCFLPSLSQSLTCGGGLSSMLCPWRMARSHFRLLGCLGWGGGLGVSNMTFIKQWGVVHRKAYYGVSGPWLLTGTFKKPTSTQTCTANITTRDHLSRTEQACTSASCTA